MRISNPSLFIVGAGPGDPELITVKGIRAIQQADVILYDALVSPALLENANENCKRVYVGKRKGKKEFAQEEINQLLVFYAERFAKVVRLKGGDINVFGRGHEEFKYAADRGISVELIPGISSSLAAPTSAGIPLTMRGVNESFWVVTGTTSNGNISTDLSLAAQSSATIVVLMGVSHLEEIADLIQKLRSPFEPMAVIQHATLPQQKTIVGSASTICQLAFENDIASPAVIVIGKVVDERRMMEEVLVNRKVKSRILKSNFFH
ncbi:MAG TPA: uroporphyrinogen-III C-methyltransferase [Chryseolinea sp.]|nr:uroporphyrinogen-III C-methyltransferase [Chryseolinea sp.]